MCIRDRNRVKREYDVGIGEEAFTAQSCINDSEKEIVECRKFSLKIRKEKMASPR